MKKALFFFFLISVITGCSSHKDNQVERMSRLYVDLLIAGEKAPFDSTETPDAVFQKYSVSADQYKLFMKNLRADRDKWRLFFNSAQRYLDSIKTARKDSTSLK